MIASTPQFDLDWHPHSRENWQSVIRRCRAPRNRTMRQFAEQEIILPTGPYTDHRFNCSRQPWAGLWFDQIDSGRWHEFAFTGPSQMGKSLCGFVIPILYHLFEVGENVLVGLPIQDMAAHKWKVDIFPVLEKTRYADLIPSSGEGIRGGKVKEITFLNGAVLKFMSSGGQDKSRAGDTFRVLVFTEIDGMETIQSTSTEADTIKQIEARAESFTYSEKVTYKECTVSTEDGHIWRTIHKDGSASRIVAPCVHCSVRVSPDRQDLHGWQGCDNHYDVVERTHFRCPACQRPYTPEQRIEMAHAARLIHKGQQDDGSGELPKTFTFGMRVGGFFNCLKQPADLGLAEFRAANEPDEDNNARKLAQFIWCHPYEPPGLEETRVDIAVVEKKRELANPKGMVPKAADWITVGFDCRKIQLHWVAVAWIATRHVGIIFDYGTIRLYIDGLNADALGYSKVFRHHFQAWRNRAINQGWMCDGGELRGPDRVLIDARWQPEPDVIYDTLKPSDKICYPSFGYGSGKHYKGKYRSKKRSKLITKVGRGYHRERLLDKQITRYNVNADSYKLEVQAALGREADQPGSLILYDSMHEDEHSEFLTQVYNEKFKRYRQPGKGWIEEWDVLGPQHYLDALALARCGGEEMGFREFEGKSVSPSRSQFTPLLNVAGPTGKPLIRV